MFSAGSPAREEREDLLALNEDREARRMDISPQTPQAGYLETGHDPGCLRLVPGAPSRHWQHEDGTCGSVVSPELCWASADSLHPLWAWAPCPTTYKLSREIGDTGV